MESSLTPEVLEKLIAFVGYGPEKPEIVFLGIEEAGGGPANISVRASHFEAIEDLFDAHEKLDRLGSVPSPFKQPGNPIEQWNTAAIFALELAGANRKLWRKFWRRYLGRRQYETFLMERFPLPRKGMSHRVSGYNPAELWQKRKEVLKGFLEKSRPNFLVAYGQPAHEACDELFEVGNWAPLANTRWDIGKTSAGTVVSRVGFFGQGLFDRYDIPAVASEMRRLAGRPAKITTPEEDLSKS